MKNVLAIAALAAAAGTAAAQPGTFTDLGVLSGDTFSSGMFDVDQVAWYRFEIAGDASGAAYLDITSNDSTDVDGGGAADTEIGLFDNAGNVVGDNDDDGIGLNSVLTYGAGSGLMLGDSFNLGGDGIANGENGPLSAGVYWLAIGEFSTNFDDGWTILDAGDEAVNYQVSIYTNIVPAPASMALLGLGGIAAIRRRR